MKISIINSDGTTTYTETLTPVEATDFSATLDEATDALNATNSTDSLSSVSSVANTSATDGYTSTTLSVPSDLLPIFQEASEKYGVDLNLLTAIARQESNFDASATSSSGAMGIMQLMPATAAGLGVEDAYDAYENIMGGSKYISELLDRYDGDTSLALAAYNAGSGNVAKYGGIPPFAETQNYVTKVLGYYSDTSSDATSGSSAVSSSATGTSSTNISSGSSPTSTLSAEERQQIYEQMLSLTNRLIANRTNEE